MLIFQYDFRLEFYGIKGKDKLGFRIQEDKPKYIIETKNGSPEVNISISNLFSSFNSISSKEAKIQIFNLPFSFNDDIKLGDIFKIYYKKFSYEKSYYPTPIMSGYLGVPLDTDYESGDFSVDYHISLISKDSFYLRELKEKQFKGKTLINAIKEVFGERVILRRMSEFEKNKVIEESFYARTPKEFTEKLKGKYVNTINVDVGTLGQGTNAVYIFSGFSKDIDLSSYKALEDYALLFIPQQDIRTGTNFKNYIIFWNASVLFTHKLNIRDSVSFRDRFGILIKGTIEESSAVLSNTGNCILNLKIYDESNYTPNE